ncbi:MAG: PrgI family protein [Firmicutes bacterium]|nr:PrgI family protein [Bacillota bacterium]MBR1736103.1 PrgI family protein [Bacillota bacterium]
MSIEVRVPEEIKDYKESIVAGLSIRQLLCGGVALLTAVPTFLLLRNIDQDLATYATMAVVVPAFCIGFIKKDGYNFETYIKIRMRSFFGKSKRTYETDLIKNIVPYELEEYADICEEISENIKEYKNERGDKSVRKKHKTKRENRAEYELVEVTEKSIKRKRKAAYKSIKAATRTNRTKKQEEKEKTESRSCTE